MKNVELYKRTWFRILISLAILFLLLISVLPYGIQYGVQRWFEQQGADSATIEDIDINLFTGKLAVNQLIVKKAGVRTLEVKQADVQLDWIPFFSKQIQVRSINLQGFFIAAEQNNKQIWQFGGITLPAAEPAEKKKSDSPAWQLALNAVTFENITIALKTPQQDVNLSINQLALVNFISNSSERADIDFKGTINKSPVELKAQLKLFSPEPGINGTLKLKDFDLSLLALQVTGHKDKLKGLLTLNSQFTLAHTPDKNTKLTTKSTLQLANLDFQHDSNHIIQDKLSWNGNSSSHFDSKFKIAGYRLEGKLGSENLVITPEQPYHYHHERLTWAGKITSAKDPLKVPMVVANLSVKGLELTQRENQQELFSTRTLDINNIHVNAQDDIKTDKIKLTGLRSFFKTAASKQKQQPALLQATELQIVSFALQPANKINIGDVQLTDALIYLHRLKNGQLMYLATSAKQQPDKSDTPAPEKLKPQEVKPEKIKPVPAKQALYLVLSRFYLTGKSKVRIIDDAVSPVFNTELKIQIAEISNLDTSKPDKGSPFKLNANLDKYSKIAFSGLVYPFAKKLSLKLDGKLSSISLPPLSSYSAQAIGYNLRSGQLNADIKASIKKGNIDALTKMTLSNLEVKSANNQQSKDLSTQLSMPLDSALSLLRNKNNDIKLDLPVKGNTDKPDFQIGGIINTAIATAMKKATMSYLIHVLQPYGSLITIAKLVKSASNAVTLNPIVFTPASASLDDSGNAYLKKILDLMQQRPELRIKVCGIAVDADRQYLIQQLKTDWLKKQAKIKIKPAKEVKPPLFTVKNDALLKIALMRSEQIKSVLVKQKIKAERLFLCNPEIDKDKKAKPRVDLSI